MSNKLIEFGIQGLEKIQIGLNKAADAIRGTLGPQGSCTIIGQMRNRPKFTKDGVTVAKAIQFADPFENAGAQIIIEAAEKTVLNVGDGTTTTTIMAQRLFNEGLRYKKDYPNFSVIKQDINAAAGKAVEHLKKLTIKVKGAQDSLLQHVATVSTNNDRYLGNLIAEAFSKAGDQGVIFVENGNSIKDTLEVKEGIEFKSGWEHPAFITNFQNSKCEFDQAFIVICEDKMADEHQIIMVLEKLWQVKKHADGKVTSKVMPIVFIAAGYTDRVLSVLLANKIKQNYPLLAITAPDFGPFQKTILRDYADMFGVHPISNDLNTQIPDMQLKDFMVAEKVSASQKTTTIIARATNSKKIQDKITELKNRANEADDPFEKVKLENRIGALTGKVVTINVGGKTKMEISEKRDRIDDATHAVKSAMEDGIVLGGGLTLFTLASKVPPKTIGQRLIREMLLSPVQQLCENANQSYDLIMRTLSLLEGDDHKGIDYQTGKIINYMEKGIVDPAKAIEESILNAVSVTNLLLGSNAVIVDEEVKKSERD